MSAKSSPALAQLRAHSLCPSPFMFMVIKQTGSITRPLIVTSFLSLVSPKVTEIDSKNTPIPKAISDLLGLIMLCSLLFEEFFYNCICPSFFSNLTYFLKAFLILGIPISLYLQKTNPLVGFINTVLNKWNLFCLRFWRINVGAKLDILSFSACASCKYQ